MTLTIEPKKTARLSIKLTESLNARLEEIAREQCITKDEVFRKAFQLFDEVSKAKKDNLRFGFFDQDRKLVTEIIGI